MTSPTLTPHQQAGVKWCREHKRGLLADDVGLGKTVVGLTLVTALYGTGELATGPGRAGALLVTEAALMPQMEQEAARFYPFLRVATSHHKAIETTDPAKRSALFDAAFPDGLDLLVVSHSVAANRLAQLRAYQPSLVIVDEASALKGGGKDYDAVRALTAPPVTRAIAMSATPLEIDPMELWRALACVHAPGLPTEAEFHSFVTWVPGYTTNRGEEIPPKPTGYTPAGLHRLNRYLPSVVLRRTVEEVGLSLPEHVGPEVEWVTLSPYTLAQYLKYERQSGKWAAAKREEISRRPLAEAAVLWLQGRPDVDKAIIYAERHERLDTVAELLDEQGIGYCRIDGTLKPAHRAQALAEFRADPTKRVLLGSRILERGINLQEYRVLLSLDSSWNPAREAQREGRIRRIGSKHATFEHVTLLGDTPQTRRKVAEVARRSEFATAVGL